MLLALLLCLLYGSQNKQRHLPYTELADWFCETEVESVYCALRTESLYETDTFNLYRVNRSYLQYHVVRACIYNK